MDVRKDPEHGALFVIVLALALVVVACTVLYLYRALLHDADR